jgi:hypothetical protein
MNNTFMIILYSIEDNTEWDSVVKSFPQYDVYYLSGYVKAFQIHGDGDPYLLYYEDNGLRAIYVYMRRKTALEGVFDSVTPYGYGGVLFEGDTSEGNLQSFWTAYLEKMAAEVQKEEVTVHNMGLRSGDAIGWFGFQRYKDSTDSSSVWSDDNIFGWWGTDDFVITKLEGVIYLKDA